VKVWRSSERKRVLTRCEDKEISTEEKGKGERATEKIRKKRSPPHRREKRGTELGPRKIVKEEYFQLSLQEKKGGEIRERGKKVTNAVDGGLDRKRTEKEQREKTAAMTGLEKGRGPGHASEN